MKNLKRILIAILVLSMSLGLFACKKNDEPDGDEDTTEPISFLDYEVIRPDITSEALIDKVSDLYMALVGLSGKENKLGSDYLAAGVEADPSKTEILIGHTNRPETRQVLEQLSGGEYAVAVVGNKIVITGLVENLTGYAIDYFITTYLSEGGDGMIAKDLFYKGSTETVVLVDKGEPIYTVVRPDVSYSQMADMTLQLFDVIYEKTGVEIPVKTDRLFPGETHDDNAYEILIGDVSYSQMDEMKSRVKPDGYNIEIVGNKILIYSWSPEGMETALDAFAEMLEFGYYVNAEGKATVCIVKEAVTGKNESLNFYTDVPLAINGVNYKSVYNAYDGAMMLYWDNATDGMLDAYVQSITAEGYTLHQELDNDSVHSVTYVKNKVSICAYYLKRVSELRVVAQDNVQILPVNPYSYEKICEPAVTQLGSDDSDFTSESYGDMGYLIRLEDGTFVVIDGGNSWANTAKRLYDTMLEQKPAQMDEIVVSAWFITHGHGDHCGVLSLFVKNYSDKVKVKMLIGNDVSDLSNGYSDRVERAFDYNCVNGKFGGCVNVKAHTGQQFFFPGATFTILSTHEDIYPKFLKGYNDYATTIFDTVIEDTRFIWLGDAEQERSPILINMYKEDLKCDVVQLSHHGNSGTVTVEVYQLCDPTRAFWPMGSYGIQSRLEGVAATRYIYNKVGAENCYIQGYGAYTIWFGEIPDTDGLGGLGSEANAEGDHTKNY